MDPKIIISNIYASNCLICMILDLLNSSHLVLARPSDKMVIYIYNKSNISTFKVIQRSTQGQRKILYKKRLTVLVVHYILDILYTIFVTSLVKNKLFHVMKYRWQSFLTFFNRPPPLKVLNGSSLIQKGASNALIDPLFP